jgi:hypothetical protein
MRGAQVYTSKCVCVCVCVCVYIFFMTLILVGKSMQKIQDITWRKNLLQ